ncbi:MAG: hypothetical protein HDT23_05930 [Ruminococcus sp.]|nr:hypothetical protein [Ruminococcus sp.]
MPNDKISDSGDAELIDSIRMQIESYRKNQIEELQQEICDLREEIQMLQCELKERIIITGKLEEQLAIKTKENEQLRKCISDIKKIVDNK